MIASYSSIGSLASSRSLFASLLRAFFAIASFHSAYLHSYSGVCANFSYIDLTLYSSSSSKNLLKDAVLNWLINVNYAGREQGYLIANGRNPSMLCIIEKLCLRRLNFKPPCAALFNNIILIIINTDH